MWWSTKIFKSCPKHHINVLILIHTNTSPEPFFLVHFSKRDKSYPQSSQWAATKEWHSNASMSGGVTWHRAGITRWGGLGDIWLQLQEGQTCRFDGKETCQLRIPAWQRWHVWGEDPALGCRCLFLKARGEFKMQALPENSSYNFTRPIVVFNTLLNLHWRIFHCRRRYKRRK